MRLVGRIYSFKKNINISFDIFNDNDLELTILFRSSSIGIENLEFLWR